MHFTFRCSTCCTCLLGGIDASRKMKGCVPNTNISIPVLVKITNLWALDSKEAIKHGI